MHKEAIWNIREKGQNALMVSIGAFEIGPIDPAIRPIMSV